MNNSDLRILLTGQLNYGKTVGEINDQIKIIEKGINKLKLRVEMEDTTRKTLQDFSKSLDKMKGIQKDLQHVYKEEETVLKKLDGTTEKVTKSYLENGKTREKIKKIINENVKATNEEADATGRLASELGNLGKETQKITKQNSKGNVTGHTNKYRNDFVETIVNTDKDGKVTSMRIIENIEKEDVATQKLIQSKNELRQKHNELVQVGQISSQQSLKLQRMIETSANPEQIKLVTNEHKRLLGISNELLKVEQARINVNKKTETEIAKERELNRVLQQKLDLYKKEQAIRVQGLKQRYKGAIDEGALDAHLGRVNNITVSKDMPHIMRETALGLKQIETNAKASVGAIGKMHSHSVSFSDALSTALQKFPIWLIAGGLTFLPIRAFQSATEQIILIDDKMTELKRVMDAPPQAFNNMLKESIALGDKLSSSVHDILTAVSGFGRQGFSENEVMYLAEASTILKNISDLDADESMNSLTSVMIQFKKEATDAIEIANKFNEIDNNFSVTTKILAEGAAKAGAVASTYNVSLDNLLGYITAISAATRESGSVVGNSLKSIFSRLNLNQSQEALKAIGVETRHANGELKSATEILDGLNNKWAGLTQETKQNLAVTVAGRYQLSRFLALMNNYQMSIDATNSSLNSQNSAMIEHEEYTRSLTARIERLKNAWTELSLGIGDAFLTDGIIVFTESLSSITKATTGLVKFIGFLPPVISTATIALIAMNTTMRTSTIDMGKQALAATSLSTRLNLLKLSALSTGTAFATLKAFMLGAFPPLILITGAAFAIEKLFSAVMKARAEQEKYNEALDQTGNNLINEKDKIEDLLTKYKELETIKENSSLNTEQEEEYVKVQSELADLLPSVTTGIDAKGNAILLSSEFLEKEIELLKEKIKLEALEAKLKAPEKFKTIREEIAAIETEMASMEKDMETIMHSGLDDKTKSQYQLNFKKALLDLEGQLILKNRELDDQYKFMFDTQNNLNENDMKFLKSLDDGTDGAIANLSELSSKISDVRNVTGNLFSTEDIELMDETQITTLKTVNEEIKNGGENWDEYKKQLNSVGFEKSTQAVEHFKKKQEELNNAVSKGMFFLDSEGNTPVTEDMLKNLGEGEKLFVKINGKIIEYVEGMDLATGAVEDFADSTYQAVSATEALFGISDQNVQKIFQAIEAITLLSNAENLNEQQKLHLANAVQFLEQQFPHLSGKIQENIFWLFEEATMMNELNKASGNMSIAMTTNQNSATKTAVEQINQRINAYNKEMDALDLLAKQRNDLANQILRQQDDTFGIQTDDMKRYVTMGIELSKRRAGLADYANSVTGAVRNFNDIFANSNKSSSGGSKGSSKASKENTYVTDKYAQSLDSLELRIKKVQDAHKNYTGISNTYRKSLQNEINLQQEKLKLTDNEIKRLENLANAVKKSGGTKNNQELDNILKDINKLKGVSVDVNRTIVDLREGISQSLFDNTINKIEKDYAAYEKKIKAINRSISIADQDDLNKQIKLHLQKLTIIKQQQLQAQANVNELKAIQSTIKNNKDALAKNTQEIEKWSDIIKDFNVELNDLTKTVSNMRNQIADQLIDAMKKFYQEKRKLELESNRKEMDMLKKSYDDKMKMLDDELKAYRGLYDEKMKEIDKQENEDSFVKELTERQRELEELQRKIATRSREDTASARLEVSKLNEELAKKEQEMQEFLHKRQVDLRKENLREELDAKQKQIEQEKESSQFIIDINGQTHIGTYEQLLERLENERDAIERHYENILENERYWSQVREDIMKGNVDEYRKMLDDFTKEIGNNMEFLGESVSQNLIDQLESVRSVLKGVIGDIKKEIDSVNNQVATTAPKPSTPTPSPPPPSSGGSGGSTGGSTSGGSTGSSGSGTKLSSLPLRKHPTGYATPKGGFDQNSVVDYIKSKGYYADFADRDALFKALKGSGTYGGSPAQNDWLLKQLKNIQGFKDGGYMGKWGGSGGRIIEAHSGEYMLKESDTENLFKIVKFTDGLMDKLQSFTNKFDFNAIVPRQQITTSTPTYNLTLNIDHLNGTQKDANNLSRTILDNLKKFGK